MTENAKGQIMNNFFKSEINIKSEINFYLKNCFFDINVL